MPLRNLVLPALSGVLFTAAASAQVPLLVGFQGRLLLPGGAPVTGVEDVTARLYHEDTPEATALWSETDSVSFTDDGVFVTTLGDSATLPTTAFARELFVGLTVDEAGGGSELSPRVALRAAPYAVTAATVVYPVTTVTAPQSPYLVTGEDFVRCDSTGGAVTVRLPPAADNPGRVFLFLRSAGASACDLERSDTTLLATGTALVQDFISDGSTWVEID